MSKKDYEKAAAIAQTYQNRGRPSPTDAAVALSVEDAFVALFAADSPRFDEARFRRACVPGANVKARTR